jgi:hypothetical protein
MIVAITEAHLAALCTAAVHRPSSTAYAQLRLIAARRVRMGCVVMQMEEQLQGNTMIEGLNEAHLGCTCIAKIDPAVHRRAPS